MAVTRIEINDDSVGIVKFDIRILLFDYVLSQQYFKNDRSIIDKEKRKLIEYFLVKFLISRHFTSFS